MENIKQISGKLNCEPLLRNPNILNADPKRVEAQKRIAEENASKPREYTFVYEGPRKTPRLVVQK